MLAGPSLATAAAVPAGDALEIRGKLQEGLDVSAVVRLGDYLVVGSDEGAAIQFLESLNGDGAWRPRPAFALRNDAVEIDIEGLAVHDSTLFAVGSHALKRKRLRADKSQADNRLRLAEVTGETSRDHLFRVRFDPADGRAVSPVETVDLSPLLRRDPILGRFTAIPGKENGVNIEALATDGKSLLLGFRSPVLRGGYTPVMQLEFEKPRDYRLLFLDLEGRGIRGMSAVNQGWLVLAGGERAGPGPHRVYLWDGLDRTPGKTGRIGRLDLLAELPAPPGAKAEGIFALDEDENGFSVIVVYDGAPDGAPTRFRLPRP